MGILCHLFLPVVHFCIGRDLPYTILPNAYFRGRKESRPKKDRMPNKNFILKDYEFKVNTLEIWIFALKMACRCLVGTCFWGPYIIYTEFWNNHGCDHINHNKNTLSSSSPNIVLLPGFQKGRHILRKRAGSSFGQKRAICVVYKEKRTEFHSFLGSIKCFPISFNTFKTL
jgi:hypothetical protein